MPFGRSPFVLLVGLCLASAVPAVAVSQGDYARALRFGGLDRDYLLHVPRGYDGASALPLVLDVHGLSSDAAQQRGISGMLALSEAEGFLVAWPNGWKSAWNANICCGNPGVDDVGFIRAVVAAVAAEVAVDPRRIYVTGLSNGGAMSHRLACEAADLFAAAAPMAFPLPYRPATGCQPARSMPVLTVMGLTDKLVPYSNGEFGSARGTFDYWREMNGCGDGIPELVEERGKSRCELDTGCTNGVEVGLCSITAQAFPGTTFSGHILYANPDFDLARVAWDFLSRFELPVAAAPALDYPLTGTDRLTLAKRLVGVGGQARVWQMRVGQGTWMASVGDVSLTGSWRRQKKSKRNAVASLTDAAVVELEEALAARIAGSVATSGLAFTVESVGPIKMTLSQTGRVTALRGRWKLLRGGRPNAVIGHYDLRLRSR